MKQHSGMTADLGFHALSGIGWVLAVLIGLCMFVLPFLTVDRNFNITPELSVANFVSAWDPVMIEAVKNSVALSVIASLFAITCGAILTRALSRWPLYVGLAIVCIYSVNPVTRAISYGDLLSIKTPLQDWAAVLFGEWSAQMIILPAIILGAHYLPIYLMRFLFVIRKRTAAHELHGLLDTVFVSIPSFLRGFPISFALFFLLTFFDYWVIQVISGGKALYWSQMFEQKAFVARDVGQAGMLIIIGLVMTFAAYLIAWVLSSSVRAFWRRLRPLTVARIRMPSMHGVSIVIAGFLGVFLAWPIIYSLMRGGMILTSSNSLQLMDGGVRSIVLTVILSSSIALCATLLSFALSAFFQEHPLRCRWWLPALYFLALVPEAAYVLFSLSVTGSGLLKASPWWLFFLMTSFSIPISFFLWQSLWGEGEQRKLWMLASAMRGQFVHTLLLALREWRRFFGITFIINFWMTVDNVFITNFAAGPKWKPVSAVIFTATKRGFQETEFLTGSVGSFCFLALIALVFLLTRQKISAVTEG